MRHYSRPFADPGEPIRDTSLVYAGGFTINAIGQIFSLAIVWHGVRGLSLRSILHKLSKVTAQDS
jgi:hypothetical protein